MLSPVGIQLLHFVANLFELVCQFLYTLFLGIEPEMRSRKQAEADNSL
jgi:hypothetical protein